MITLSNGATSVELPDALTWADEFSWGGVDQAVGRSITGALIVQEVGLAAGRPITLEAEDRFGWTTRATVSALAALAALPAAPLTLNMRGVTYDVAFRRQDGPFVATPVISFDDDDPDDFYRVRVRLMTV